MFGSIGGAEILVILTLALLLFGPRKLPEIGRTLGKTLGELRRASSDFKSSLEREVEIEQVKDARDGLVAARDEISDAMRDSNPLSSGTAADSGGDAEDPPNPTQDAGNTRNES